MTLKLKKKKKLCHHKQSLMEPPLQAKSSSKRCLLKPYRVPSMARYGIKGKKKEKRTKEKREAIFTFHHWQKTMPRDNVRIQPKKALQQFSNQATTQTVCNRDLPSYLLLFSLLIIIFSHYVNWLDSLVHSSIHVP